MEKLEYYTMVISWYYVLLDHWRKRQAKWKSEEEDVRKHKEEIPLWEKAYSDQFVIADTAEPSPSFTYRDLPQWIQCIQPVVLSALCYVDEAVSDSFREFPVSRITIHPILFSDGLSLRREGIGLPVLQGVREHRGILQFSVD